MLFIICQNFILAALNNKPCHPCQHMQDRIPLFSYSRPRHIKASLETCFKTSIRIPPNGIWNPFASVEPVYLYHAYLSFIGVFVKEYSRFIFVVFSSKPGKQLQSLTPDKQNRGIPPYNFSLEFFFVWQETLAFVTWS